MTTMPAGPMTCDGFADALMDYLEHDAAHAVRVAVEEHAATCASCAALLADVRRIERDAARLPELQPSRDLWTGIAARIEAPVVDLEEVRGTRYGVRDGKRSGMRWVRRSLIAAGLVAISAGTTWMLARRDRSPSPAQKVASQEQPAIQKEPAVATVAEQPAESKPEEAVRPSSHLVPRTSYRVPASLARNAPTYRSGAYRQVDSLYGAEIGRLRRIADTQKKQLDPATIAIIEKNLKIIDMAIRESRAAIARDPNSALLNDQINRMLDQKVELLRALAAMPARS